MRTLKQVIFEESAGYIYRKPFLQDVVFYSPTEEAFHAFRSDAIPENRARAERLEADFFDLYYYRNFVSNIPKTPTEAIPLPVLHEVLQKEEEGLKYQHQVIKYHLEKEGMCERKIQYRLTHPALRAFLLDGRGTIEPLGAYCEIKVAKRGCINMISSVGVPKNSVKKVQNLVDWLGNCLDITSLSVRNKEGVHCSADEYLQRLAYAKEQAKTLCRKMIITQ